MRYYSLDIYIIIKFRVKRAKFSLKYVCVIVYTVVAFKGIVEHGKLQCRQ